MTVARHRGGVARSVPVAVLDTSVLYGEASRRQLVSAVNEGRFDGVWSPHVIAELNRVLTIRWLREHGSGVASLRDLSQSAKKMMAFLFVVLRLVDTSRTDAPTIDLRDADDYHLVHAARLGRAAFVVSANTRDFPPPGRDGRRSYDGIEFIEPAPFLARLAKLRSR
ncbi:MAG: PIN domain-containing protein [Candidatus Eremiobacteraeota bacterium]|nr:PIN domain-containing protein [Candidatus Eremiobacteraeota bacterium]